MILKLDEFATNRVGHAMKDKVILIRGLSGRKNCSKANAIESFGKKKQVGSIPVNQMASIEKFRRISLKRPMKFL